MFRWFRAIVNKVMGWFGAKGEALEEDPDAISNVFDRAIRESGNRKETTKQAVAKLMGVQQKQSARFNELTSIINTLSKRKDGAAARMKQLSLQMQAKGATNEQIKGDSEIIKALQTYTDLTAKLEERIKESKEKEEGLQKLSDNLNRLKASLQSMQRNQDSLREEKEGAIADVVSAKDQMAVDALMSGASQQSVDVDLEHAREARRNVVNRAQLTSEMKNLQSGASGEEYEKYATEAAIAGNLDALLGLENKQPVLKKLGPAQLAE
jgi:chromosome segregation ATPase